MKVFENLQLFFDALSSQQNNQFGFNNQQLVRITHISDSEYQTQVNKGQDELGFQPLLLKFADPFEQKTDQVLVKNVNDEAVSKIKDYFRRLYVANLPVKFGSFTPDVYDAYTEYDSWEEFSRSWFVRDGRSVFHINIPLLFDHISDVEYWTKKQSGEKVLEYQRLLITTYLTRENKFYRFFIKNVNDEEFNRIKLLVQSQVGLSSDGLYE